jgi:DNA replication and repair protein RecF
LLIETLRVRNVRNLGSVELAAHPRLNYLFGDNGAGKTSLLEAISVLSRGRSFRASQATELLGPNERSFQVYAAILGSNGSRHRLGLERSGSHWRGRIDGKDVAQLSQLSRMLPVVVMEPDSHLLVSGSPEVRRRYLDWGMFHVEHEFLDVARNFNRALKQRNAALRQNNPGLLDSIDEVFADWGEQLSIMRSRHSERLASGIGSIMNIISDSLEAVELNYQAGWRGDSFQAALQGRRERDLERGASGVGPHRAELEISISGRAAKTVLSRGEQKVLSAALLFLQADLMAGNGVQPILLLDDLGSEFDDDHFDRVLKNALESGSQVWLSGTARAPAKGAQKVFHVEQGNIRELV